MIRLPIPRVVNDVLGARELRVVFHVQFYGDGGTGTPFLPAHHRLATRSDVFLYLQYGAVFFCLHHGDGASICLVLCLGLCLGLRGQWRIGGQPDRGDSGK